MDVEITEYLPHQLMNLSWDFQILFSSLSNCILIFESGAVGDASVLLTIDLCVNTSIMVQIVTRTIEMKPKGLNWKGD